MNVAGWADRQLDREGDFEALIFEGVRYSNRQLHEQSCRLAGGLVSLGLEPGDRVVLWLPNGIDLVELFSATIRAGAVAIVLSEHAPKAEVRRILGQTEARALFSRDGVDLDGPEFRLGLAQLGQLAQHPPLAAAVERLPEDLAQIVFTSGSSGLSKGVAWTHGLVAARYLGFADQRPAGAAPRRSLCVLPLSASFGAQYLYLRWLQKMTLVLAGQFHPATTLSLLREHQVQTAMLVPSMAEALLAHLGGATADLPSLRSLLIGGSTVTPSLVQRVREQLKVRVSSVYGLTELGPVARTEPGQSSGSLGKLADGVQVRLQAVPGEEVGEIQVRAPEFQGSYYGEERSSDEWLSTGDLGYFDDQGQLRLVGRRHERIVTGGLNVYPQPLEELFCTHPEVADCAVVGVEDPYLGEEVVAWVVRLPEAQVDEAQLLAFGRLHLETRKAPSRVYFRQQLPRNDGGKVQRAILRDEAASLGQAVRKTELANLLGQVSPARRLALLRETVKEELAKLTEIPAAGHGGRSFAELGLDSMAAVMLANSLSFRLGLPLPATLTFQYPTVDVLVDGLNARLTGSVAPQPTSRSVAPAQRCAIAIVGAACRLPGGVENPEQFWQLLQQGRSATEPILRWPLEKHYDPRPGTKGKTYTRHAALIDHQRFDRAFFGLNRAEAQNMDPQHRIALEVSWQALESAGYAPRSQSRLGCGVFLGLSGMDWGGGDPLGRLPSMGAGRIAHLLDLRGPVMAIDTACSSGLVAVHTAVQNLRLGSCDMALAGGVNVIASLSSFVALSQIGALSPDGLCKAFDASADGFGRGEGCVMLLLRRLDDALADHNEIWAVIRGTAVNHDGRSSSLMAPRGPAQQEVALAALQDADIAAGDIDFLEAHGSGTALGDPIEIEAALTVYGQRPRPLLVGSVKSNIGHLEAAAGAAGLLKAALALRYGELPAHLHYRRLHPGMAPWADRLVVPTSSVPLADGGPHRAAITSLGMAGTNAVVILESAPPIPMAGNRKGSALLCLSGRTQQALQAASASYLDLLDGGGGCAQDLGFTSAVGREHFQHRLAVVGDTPQQLADGLRLARPLPPARAALRLGFLCTGQGSLYPGAGQQLLQSEPAFAAAMHRCAEIFRSQTGHDLTKVLGSAADQQRWGQPALFALEWSLAQLWSAWGVEPEWLLGHSLGEYVAACLAGVFSLEDGLRLVIARGELMTKIGGAMLNLRVDPQQARALIDGRDLDIAALNAPLATVVSGSLADIELLEQSLKQQAQGCRRLAVTTAYHSRLVAPIQEGFRQALSTITLHPPCLSVVSTVSGGLLSADQACSLDYWTDGLTATVQFQAAIHTLREHGASAFLEVGPSRVLSELGRSCFGDEEGYLWASSLVAGQPERASMLMAAAALYEAGANLEWPAVYAGMPVRRVSAPTYPFHVISGQAVPKAAPTGAETLAEAVQAVLETSVLPDDDLFEHGLDSLRMMQLISDLRLQGHRLSAADLLAHPTLAKMEAFLKAPLPTSSLVAIGPTSGNGTPLFCLHPAGGQIGAYLQFRSLLSAERPLFAVQSKALEDPETEFSHVSEMASAYAQLISQAAPEGPLALLGWSFGGLLAGAVALLLEQAGLRVSLVTVIDPPHPGQPGDLAQSLLAVLANHNARPPGLTPLRQGLRLHNPADPVAGLYAFVVQQGWLKQEALDERRFLGQLRLHQKHMAMPDQVPAFCLKAPLEIWWARRSQKDQAAWNSRSQSWVRHVVLGGDHYSIMRPPRVAKIVLPAE